MVVGAWTGVPAAGALGAVAGLSFLYLPMTRLHERIPVIMACAFAMVASYALGVASSFAPGIAIVFIACLAAAATLFCKTQSVFPPGPIFMVMAASIAAFSPIHTEGAVLNLGYFVLGCIWACAVALAYSMYILRHRAAVPRVSPTREELHAVLIDAVIIALFVGLSLALAGLLDLRKPYWVPVSCLAVMQGMNLRASWSRNVHRIVGTAIGLGFAWLLLPFVEGPWAVALAVMVLTFAIETAVVRHYAFAAIFITPLTIILAERSNPGAASVGALMEARLIDTVIGAMIGLTGALCLHRPGLRRVLERGLAALAPREPTR